MRYLQKEFLIIGQKEFWNESQRTWQRKFIRSPFVIIWFWPLLKMSPKHIPHWHVLCKMSASGIRPLMLPSAPHLTYTIWSILSSFCKFCIFPRFFCYFSLFLHYFLHSFYSFLSFSLKFTLSLLFSLKFLLFLFAIFLSFNLPIIFIASKTRNMRVSWVDIMAYVSLSKYLH